MCGRFTLATVDVEQLARALAAEVDHEQAKLFRPRWNLAPTGEAWIVRLDEHGRRRLVRARFGFQSPGGRFVINARSETAASLPTFRQPFSEGRCLVPVDGFFEWRGGRADRRPLWFHDPSGGLLLFAGLVAERDDAIGFAILTTAANELVRPIHDRMPAILSPADAESWLVQPRADLLVPAPVGTLVAREVSAKVNSANDGPELLHPPAPEPQLKLI